MKEANDKLEAAQEASRKAAEEAKKKAREIKTCTGLARPIGPHNPAFITHRGIGAFCQEDFSKITKRQKVPPSVLPKPKRPAANGEVQENESQLENDDTGAPVEGGEEEENESKNGEIQGEISEQIDEQDKEMASDEPVNNGGETPEINGEGDAETTENGDKVEEKVEGSETLTTPQDTASKICEENQDTQAGDEPPEDAHGKETQENKDESSEKEQTETVQETSENAQDSEETPQENAPESSEKEQETQTSEAKSEDQTDDDTAVKLENTADEESRKEHDEIKNTEESTTAGEL